MEIREYRTEDCPQLARLFYDTVHSINTRDYTKEQVDAWADGRVDIDGWNTSFLEHYTLVAVDSGIVADFGDIDARRDTSTGSMFIRIIRAWAWQRCSATAWKAAFTGDGLLPTLQSPQSHFL